MADVFIVNFGPGGDSERRRKEDAKRKRLFARYTQHLVEAVQIDHSIAERVITTLFDHRRDEGRPCRCGCHPQLSDDHDDGFDCPCSWDDQRREREHRAWDAYWDSPEAKALAEHHEAEERAIAEWLAGQAGVTAKRTTSYAPEQWEGSVDGRTFYFRERHGFWRIELDLEPSGRFANRLVEARADGELVTEPVPIMEGEVIAEGAESDLGDGPVAHIEFIVRSIRDHLWCEQCDHAGALFYCPKCGQRMEAPA